MYKKVETNLNFVEREKNIAAFWRENQIFEKSVENRKNNDSFIFYEGPPTANGMPHIGHVLTRVIKDLVPRYQTMKGNMVPRKAGWDTHGLPVEIEVEKMLGINGKEQIEEYGLEPFINKCKESVWKYRGLWEDFSDIVGYWVDNDNPYVTYDNNYIESEWWALKKIWEKGLLYKGFKIVPYCPRCGTPLSTHEVSQGYKDVKERSAFVKFKLKDEDAFMLAWTTTPWTLPSNVSLCVHPEIDYVKVLKDDETYYLAEDLLEKVLKDGYEIIERYKGKDLEYKKFIPLFDFAPLSDKGWYVTCGDFVTTGDGTGIVHMAPAFGEDDAAIARKYDLPFVQFVDSHGNMTEETPWAGMFCKKADIEVLKALEDKGQLFSAPMFEHSYPHCWRCDTPLIYYARESWFIEMTAVRDDLVSNNNTINWIPESIGKGRFGAWIENVQDWSISRNRYWGTPLNIWECDCGHFHSIGSIEELKSLSKNCPGDIELHRPFIDAITFPCTKCGKEMHRVPEVIDSWFDSGSMPFAQHHYPFENQDLFEQQFPADFISEGVDQTRGWFYSLLAISTLIFNKAPFKNVIVMGHVQDENGQKMSKSKGNAVDPFDALKAHGADAIRWYFYTNSAPWLPNRFHAKAVEEGQRKFMGTLWNTYAFFVLYANIDKFDASKYELEYDKLSVMDKWLLSRLNSTIKEVDNNLSNYKITEAGRAIEAFVDEMSNWYVRRSRERYWTPEMNQDKINAYLTLYTALVNISKAAAPMVPFMADEIYQNLVRSIDKSAPLSIHLCDFPICNDDFIDKSLEENMDEVLKIVVLGRAARNGANLKNRQPLAKMQIKAELELDKFYTDIIRDELNIKEVSFIENADGLVSYIFKPQLKTLGPKYGKQLNEIRTALQDLDTVKAKQSLDNTGELTLNISIGEIKLSTEDILIESQQKEDTYALTDKGITIALDTNLTNELIEEGYVREVISKIQTMRKDAGFDVVDRIKLSFNTSEHLQSVLNKNKEVICADVLADDISFNQGLGFTKAYDINGENAEISISKI